MLIQFFIVNIDFISKFGIKFQPGPETSNLKQRQNLAGCRGLKSLTNYVL